MTAITPRTVYCPTCGTENDDYLERCIGCDALLDPAAEAAVEHARPPRPFHVKSLGITAGVAVVLVVVLQLLGLTFSMEVLPASESAMETETRVEALVAAGELSRGEGDYINREMFKTEVLREALANNELGTAESQAVREKLRPADQSVVLGLGGISSLFPPLLGFSIAALVAVAVVRVRRLYEVGLGATIGRRRTAHRVAHRGGLPGRRGVWRRAVDDERGPGFQRRADHAARDGAGDLRGVDGQRCLRHRPRSRGDHRVRRLSPVRASLLGAAQGA